MHKYTVYMLKQFYLKQFSLAQVHSLDIKTVLFQVIQFSISIHFRCIWSIDRALSSATTPGQSGPESIGTEGVLCISKVPALLEPHHQIV